MKKMHCSVRACAVLLAYFCATASAQTVYKCANTYSDTPCPQGVAVPTADPRSPAQKAQTDQATAQAQALAGQMEKTRQADEAAAQRRADSQAKAAAQAAKAVQVSQAKALRAEAKAKKKQATTKVAKPATTRQPTPAGEPAKPPAGSGKAPAAVTLKR
jgi:hypothetical protein